MSKIDKLIENGVKSLMIENLEEKAVSKNQQQFMGMVHAYKKGEMKDAPASVKKAAKGMTKKAAKDFASTKHKGLPTKVDEGVMSELDIELQDSKTFEEFLANVKSNPRFKSLNVDKPDVQEFLLDLFNQQKGSANESTLNEADEIGGYYLMSTLQDLADDSKRIGDTKMYDAYMYLHDRIEQSYRDIDLNQDDIKDLLNEPQGRKHINNFPDWAIKDLFTESTKQLKENKMIKEYTDKNFLGRDLINKVNSKKPDAEGAEFIEEFFPNGFKSQQKAVQALRASDASPIKKRMGQYAPMFVHVQFHEFTDQAGEKYGVHQTQYYNSNFKDKPGGENFNPSVTKLYIYKRKDPNNPSPQAQKDQAIGTILVKTDEYIKDLELLRRGGQLGQRVSESTKETKMNAKTEALTSTTDLKTARIIRDLSSKIVPILDKNLGKLSQEQFEMVDNFLAKLINHSQIKENKMNTKTESIVKRLKEDTEYQKFFKSAMDKFGVKSPKELSDKKKKEFFNYVDKNYKAKSEGKITEAYFGAHGGDSAELKKAKAALANWFNNISAVPRNQLDILHDLIDDYAYEYAQDWASGNMM